ncbi:MAG: hypothetical protein ACOY42_10215 [Pseudomonadota bacterium]
MEVDSASIQVNRPRRRANTDVIPAQASALVIPAQASTLVIPAQVSALVIPAQASLIVIPAQVSALVIPALAGIQSGGGLDPGFRRGDEEWAVG